MGEELTGVRLAVRGTTVAEYVLAPEIDPRWSPRPHLHPVRTLAGVPVTDTLPEDHRWHLGVSVAIQDVSGTNLWGGRTYLRGVGYTWREDHGRIVHDAWTAPPDEPAGAVEPTEDGFAERLRWLDPAGRTLLVEQRRVRVGELPGSADAWLLDFAYTLTAPAGQDVVLGSPATNGRPGGAGYGGFFWRAAAGPTRAFTAGTDGEETANGSTEPWLALTGEPATGTAYTLVFTGLGAGDHWFVRTGGYPGVCVALAFERPLTIGAGSSLHRRHRVVVADGELSRDRAAELVAGLPG